MGVEGLMVPMVGSADEARRVVAAMKYPPSGARGVALQIAHDRYRPGSVRDKFAAANEKTTLFCLIETADGVNDVEAIAAIDEVDCLWIGHFDLSVSLGIPGEFDHKEFISATDKIITAAKKHNKSLGHLVPSVERGIELSRQGFNFICYSGDVWVLHDALANAVQRLRAGCATGVSA